MMLVIPAFKYNIFQFLIYTIFHHLTFIFTYLLLSKISELFQKLKVIRIDLLLLAFFLGYELFVLRFKIDKLYAMSSFVFTEIITIVISLIMLILIYVLLNSKYALEIPNSKSENKKFLVQKKKMNHGIRIFMLFIRDSRISLYLILSFIIASTAYFSTKSIKLSFETFLMIFPMISITGLAYYSKTKNERKLYFLYNFKTIKEVILILTTFLILGSPIMLKLVYTNNLLEMYSMFILNFQVFLVLGILFPRGESPINEISALILGGIVLITFSLIFTKFKEPIIIIVVIILLAFLNNFLLNYSKERT